MIFGLGLLLTIWLSNFVSLGHELDSLRNGVLRIHILANSDSDEDQALKLQVRDVLLEHSDELFSGSGSVEEALLNAEGVLNDVEEIAQQTVCSMGYDYKVHAEIVDMHFDNRVYGDITMPSGMYTALRVTIGEAEGHNWWCVMYPPLCIPAAGEVIPDEKAEDIFFSDTQQEIMHNPQKYKVRFAIWDKVKSWF